LVFFIERAEVARVQEIATYLNGEIASILEKVPLAALIDVDTAEILLFFSLHIVYFLCTHVIVVVANSADP
jgi:hypothetical protein